MSAALDANLGVLRRVQADLLRVRKVDAKRGREGMTAEQVVRAALVKQMFGSSYEQLSFQLGDSLVLRGFCRLSPSAASPKRSTLQANIAAIRSETWEAMNKPVEGEDHVYRALAEEGTAVVAVRTFCELQ
jgi:IS5 family transposase